MTDATITTLIIYLFGLTLLAALLYGFVLVAGLIRIRQEIDNLRKTSENDNE